MMHMKKGIFGAPTFVANNKIFGVKIGLNSH